MLLVVYDCRQLSRLSEAYTADEFCRHILPVIIGNLAKDQVAAVRQAAVEAVSFLLFLQHHYLTDYFIFVFLPIL